MEYTIAGKSPEKMEEKHAKCLKLRAERSRLNACLEKVEREKESVAKRIYDKVRAEYAGKLDDIRDEIDPIEYEIEEYRREGESELFDLGERIRVLEEELAEAEFRTRVGEFKDSKLEKIQTNLQPELSEKLNRQKELRRSLSALSKEDLEESRSPRAEDKAPDNTEESVYPEIEIQAPEEESETPEIISETPEVESEAPEEEEENREEDQPQESLFENPQDWIDELGEDRKSTTETKENTTFDTTAKQSETDDPLSALADPSNEKRETIAPAKNEEPEEPEEPVSVGFPNLVIVTGHGSGKKIPLLPMTMSIGREHDNNIELKDPEVARYHARIMYERGHFVLEDMESNNNTWINGEQTKHAMLKNGDRIKIGETEMVIDFD